VLTRDNGGYIANCVLFDHDDWRTLREKLGERAGVVAQIIHDHGKALDEIIRDLVV